MHVGLVQAIAREIMDNLGVGYSEAIYRHAMYRELLAQDSATVAEPTVPILYKGHFLGTCRADLVCSGFVIEIKALKTVVPIHDTVGNQIKKYLRHLHELHPHEPHKVGLVINFNQCSGTAEFLLFQNHVSQPPVFEDVL